MSFETPAVVPFLSSTSPTFLLSTLTVFHTHDKHAHALLGLKSV